MKKFLISILLGVMVLLSSCTDLIIAATDKMRIGPQVSKAQTPIDTTTVNIIKNKTTKQEILAVLGQPDNFIASGNYERMSYSSRDRLIIDVHYWDEQDISYRYAIHHHSRIHTLSLSLRNGIVDSIHVY